MLRSCARHPNLHIKYCLNPIIENYSPQLPLALSDCNKLCNFTTKQKPYTDVVPTTSEKGQPTTRNLTWATAETTTVITCKIFLFEDQNCSTLTVVTTHCIKYHIIYVSKERAPNRPTDEDSAFQCNIRHVFPRMPRLLYVNQFSHKLIRRFFLSYNSRCDAYSVTLNRTCLCCDTSKQAGMHAYIMIRKRYLTRLIPFEKPRAGAWSIS